MSTLLTQAQALIDWSRQHHRHLHQYPEKSLDEKHTSAYCQQVLSDLGYEISPSWGYGFTAMLRHTASPNAKIIALRTDMDALPMEEQNTHDFVSKHPGVAHMCGHDVHMTIALTAARLLAEQPQPLANQVRFLFQPNEETVPGGSVGMIAHNCLANVDEVYGLHNEPTVPVGTLCTRVGALTANANMFSITIHGKGCHAAMPAKGLDPIPVACNLVNLWQSMLTRLIDPQHTAVLSVTQMHAGEAHNVIPDQIQLGGTIRSFDLSDHQRIQDMMRHTLEALTPLGYHHQLHIGAGNESIINTSEGVAQIKKAALSMLSPEHIQCDAAPFSWGEDFWNYLKVCKGAFFVLGSGNLERGIKHPLHSPYFEIDETAIPLGAALMAQLVIQSRNE